MRRHRAAAGLVVALALFASVGSVWAAGEWEWTKGQGWVMGAGASRPTPKEQLHYAYQLEQKGEYMDSARQYFLLIQNFPDSEEAGVGLQRLARCLFEMENYYTAYKAIEQVIQTYPGTGRMSDLIEIELRIAKKMMITDTPDLLAVSNDSSKTANIKRGLEIVDAVIKHDPYGPMAPEAYLVKGEGNLYIGEISTARTAFEKVRDEFPRSDYVERARLGILQCDSLVGQANPNELKQQMDLVREEEAERRKAGQGFTDDTDDVEHSLKKMAEVEAAKMMEQAEQYRRMGTRSAVQSSEFLYKEVARRYPGTTQADEANERLGKLKIPREESRLRKGMKGLTLNPFNWNKDPEPPWIVPQLDPEDVVMVDSGLGPILGVPETGLPSTRAAAGVRPAGLDTTMAATAALDSAPFSPDPTLMGTAGGGGYSPAPSFVDATSGVGPSQTYVSDPQALAQRQGGFVPPPPGGMAPDLYSPAPMASGSSLPLPPSGPGVLDLGPARSARLGPDNPIPSISENDLVDTGGSSGATYLATTAPVGHQSAPQPTGSYADLYTTAYQTTSTAPVYASTPAPATGYVVQTSPQPYGVPMQQQPHIGNISDATVSDLVGPARMNDPVGSSAPAPYYAPPAPAPYGQGATYQTVGGTYTTAPSDPFAPTGAGQPNGGGQGGWTLGEDFR